MIELRILSGSRNGEIAVFPGKNVAIGRRVDPWKGLAVDGAGVWDRHAEISLGADRRFHIQALGGGIVSVGQVPLRESPLGTGDRIELGSLILEFRLAPACQAGLRLHEAVVWSLVVLVTALQAFLLLFLSRA
jgi:hypothetical protein